MSLARISLNPPPLAFAPSAGRIQRVTLAWWDPAEPEGKREPILVASRTAAARTLVVAWPTDARGNLDLLAINGGRGVEVMPWDLTERDLQLLRYLASAWPLDRYDLYVSAAWFGPTQDTLRSSFFWTGHGLDARIEAAIARESG